MVNALAILLVSYVSVRRTLSEKYHKGNFLLGLKTQQNENPHITLEGLLDLGESCLFHACPPSLAR